MKRADLSPNPHDQALYRNEFHANFKESGNFSIQYPLTWYRTCFHARTATHYNTLQHTATHCNTLQHTATHCNTLQCATHDIAQVFMCDVGWLWLVGSFKLYVSFAGFRLFYRALLQKRPILLRSLLIVATPYRVRFSCAISCGVATTTRLLKIIGLFCKRIDLFCIRTL